MRFVNAVLDEMIGSPHGWQLLADRWIEGVAQIPDPVPPAADYRRSE